MGYKFEKIKAPDGFEYYPISNLNLPSDSFIVRHQAFRDVLYNLQAAGIGLQEKMEFAGCAFAQAISDLALGGGEFDRAGMAELVFLSGGLYYNLNSGFKRKFGFSLPQCFMGIQRVRLDGEDGRFTARVSYENFESLPDHATLVIGDTIATGATLLRGLQHLGNVLEEKGTGIEKIIFVTLAGSNSGGQRLLRAHRHLQAEHPNLKTYFIAAEQLFHLMPDGTDLRFSGKDAVAPPATAQYTEKEYGSWLAQNMKCAVLDWGTRCKNPMKHYWEFEHVAGELLKRAPDEKSKSVLSDRLAKCMEEEKAYKGKN